MEGRDYCYFHDPGTSEKRRESRRLGGHKRHGVDLDSPRPDVTLETAGDCLTYLAVAVADCLMSGPSLSRARALAYVLSTAVRTIEITEVERRLTILEEKFDQ